MTVETAHGVPALHPERRGQLNISPKVNWVERRGGLPPYINSVATALQRQGFSRPRAIATAVNTVRKACSTGLWGGQKRKISGAIQAAACAAAAQWEALKVGTSITDDERLAVELAKTWRPEEPLEPLELAVLELCKARSLEPVELAAFFQREPKAKLTGRRRPGLVQVLVTVRSRRGNTFRRRQWVRPKDAKRMIAGRGNRSLGSAKATARGRFKRRKGKRIAVSDGYLRRWNALPAERRRRLVGDFKRLVKLRPGYRMAEDGTVGRVENGRNVGLPKRPAKASPKPKTGKSTRSGRRAKARKSKRTGRRHKQAIVQPARRRSHSPRRNRIRARKVKVRQMAAKTVPAGERRAAAAKGQTAYGTSYPIRNRDELRRAIAAYGRAPAEKRAQLRRFIMRRARALGASDMIPDSWKGSP